MHLNLLVKQIKVTHYRVLLRNVTNCTAKDFLNIHWLMKQIEFPQFLGSALFPLCLGSTQQRPRQQAGAGQQRRQQRGGGGRASAPGQSPWSGDSSGVIGCQWHHLAPLLPQHRGGGGLCHRQDSHLGSPSRGEKIYWEASENNISCKGVARGEDDVCPPALSSLGDGEEQHGATAEAEWDDAVSVHLDLDTTSNNKCQIR